MRRTGGEFEDVERLFGVSEHFPMGSMVEWVRVPLRKWEELRDWV